ncbi:MAG: hypothetical protein FK730_00075 [Asgard group archaeon]|nr:hypothetical protein [Asgard group archaeon]
MFENRNEEKVMRTKKIISIISMGIILIVLGTISFVQAQKYQLVVVWEELFEESLSDDWVVQSYQYSQGKYANITDPNQVYSIDSDGVFRPYPDSGYLLQAARRNSTVAYGKWSFDWASETDTTQSRCVNAFIFSSPVYGDDWEGLDESEILATCTGYGLIIDSKYQRLELLAYPNSWLYLHSLNDDIIENQSYHIDITRNLVGNISVFWDYNYVFSVVDKDTTTSESCLLVSFSGDSGFDNFNVSEWQEVIRATSTTEASTTTPDTNTPSLELATVVPTLGLIALLISKKKRSQR